ncbi:MAG: hypothetical protein KF785_11585 [Gemmatimonadales bacterium]|nr:hypothetical protein [Gemmatimonadales bacterium]
MGFEELKARLDRLLNEQGLGRLGRSQTGILHDALVDLKVGLKDMTDALDRTVRELAAEQEHLAAALRRGQLADDINDSETATIAREFADRHRQRIGLLERKQAVQQDELALAQQEYDTLADRYRVARRGIGDAGSRGPGSEDELAGGPAGMADPTIDSEESSLLKARLDRQRAESVADAQLEMLKRKMGKGS